MVFPNDFLANTSELFWLQERSRSKVEDDVEIITREKAPDFVS